MNAQNRTPNSISDHYGTYIYIKCESQPESPYKRRVWNYRQADFDALNNHIRDTDWTFLNSGTIDHATEDFCDKFINLAKSHIPTYLTTIRPNDKPWYNSEIRLLSRQRDRQKRTAIRTERPTDWGKYKQLRNKVNNMKKHAKEGFYNNLEYSINDLSSTNPREYWKIVKMLMKDSAKGGYTIPPLIKTDQTFATSDQEKANTLNDYFISISSVDDSEAVLPNITLKTNNTLSNIHITEQEIRDVLSNLVTNKASGPDEISHRMLKETRMTISEPLQILFSRSLSSGNYPNIWKIANVMPVFKKGDSSMPSNYRPISLISCVGKVMERVIFKHIYNYLHTNNLIYKYQSGFLPGHSTVFQLIDIYNQICKAFDEKKSTCIVFCDISKAFDRVWHRGLLHKIRQYGITGNLNNWLSNYLTDRSQKVFVSTSYSDIQDIGAGVPQGSVLGPLLFLIYVNDIADSLTSMTRLFADDSSLAVSSADPHLIETTINNDLVSLSNWSKQWLVKFNPIKTEVMYFSLSNQHRPTLLFNDTPLTSFDNHRHLGLTLSHDGTWHEHISFYYRISI